LNNIYIFVIFLDDLFKCLAHEPVPDLLNRDPRPINLLPCPLHDLLVDKPRVGILPARLEQPIIIVGALDLLQDPQPLLVTARQLTVINYRLVRVLGVVHGHPVALEEAPGLHLGRDQDQFLMRVVVETVGVCEVTRLAVH